MLYGIHFLTCAPNSITQDSARLDFVELRPAKVSTCKHRRVSPKPSSAAPLTERYLPLQYLYQFLTRRLVGRIGWCGEMGSVV